MSSCEYLNAIPAGPNKTFGRPGTPDAEILLPCSISRELWCKRSRDFVWGRGTIVQGRGSIRVGGCSGVTSNKWKNCRFARYSILRKTDETYWFGAAKHLLFVEFWKCYLFETRFVLPLAKLALFIWGCKS